MLAELKFCMTTWFFYVPPSPTCGQMWFFDQPPSPPVCPRDLRMAPYTKSNSRISKDFKGFENLSDFK